MGAGRARFSNSGAFFSDIISLAILFRITFSIRVLEFIGHPEIAAGAVFNVVPDIKHTPVNIGL